MKPRVIKVGLTPLAPANLKKILLLKFPQGRAIALNFYSNTYVSLADMSGSSVKIRSMWSDREETISFERTDNIHELSQSWQAVLEYCFPRTERFHVAYLESYYSPTTLESAGTFNRLKVFDQRRPTGSWGTIAPNVVFIVLLELESRFGSKYWRGMLDHEIRSGMEEMRKVVDSMTSIYGLAVFGRRMAVYTKRGDDATLPPRPPFDPVADLAPEALWGLELTSAEGMDRLKDIAAQIKTACADDDTESVQRDSDGA
ncbi:hypothetical protein C8F04DRAFT_1199890 [Mycena alexandri]|uniref:Uncharacterized protein n=1 Tax=Mycena alexandri TaxID=1745969 RepID=A0AAD6RZF1_9AGAR|nr:hypothetical protein C8F04DRAFT_1199890 [Mycena alexandri]